MGTYLNPSNNGFERIIKGHYIDKTGMIDIINKKIDTTNNLICISRPRRFGKSYAAQMLCAYYDCTCDSHNLFNDKDVSKTKYYEEHINKYNIIYLDIAGFLSNLEKSSDDLKNVVNKIEEYIHLELIADYPELKDKPLSQCIIDYVEKTNKKFIFIIDEWDAIIRENKNDTQTQKAYLNLLRSWFKNGNFTPKVVACAYMTGILPIKKDKGQSAISDFDEFSVLEPAEFSEYIGFTENEVKQLCDDYNMNFDKAKRWYDGYTFSNIQSIYNPYSIMKAMNNKVYRSYWQKTSAAENLETLININKDGLQEDILKLIAGEKIVVKTSRFKNDFTSFSSKDDVLTLLIHLGYLVYDYDSGRVHIPNEEVRFEFDELLQNSKHTQLGELVTASKKLLQATLNGEEEFVATTINKVQKMIIPENCF